MHKSYRIRTTPGVDKNINVTLEQDFDLLEILSLKLTQSEVYSRLCADFGVVVGRVLANGGYGIPNAKVSIFIPLSDEDDLDPVISELYPYKETTDKNELGYRYNLLSSAKQNNCHTPTGSFPTEEEVLLDPLLLEVYDKYYKFTVKTNKSGDYMIWGLPLGVQKIHLSVDVGDIGCHSMKPIDFIVKGVSPDKFKSYSEFKASSNLDTLPQVIIQEKSIEITPFWGSKDLCNIGITRVDFDLRDSGVEIQPTSTLMGAIMSDDNAASVNINGSVSRYQGDMCSLTTGPGTIEAVRFTIFDRTDPLTGLQDGKPHLEFFNLEGTSKVIDDGGTFTVQVPMNLDYIITNEFGDEIISLDDSVGIPTRGKYRFRIGLDSSSVGGRRKAKYLVPNIHEYNLGAGSGTGTPSANVHPCSYAFSDNIDDYCGTPVGAWQTGVVATGKDYFYEFYPDKVYTVAGFIDRWRRGHEGAGWGGALFDRNRWRFLGIKSINPAIESKCSDATNEIPSNDAFRGGTYLFTITQFQTIAQGITIFFTFFTIFFVYYNAFTVYMNDILTGLANIAAYAAGTIVAGLAVAVSSIINLALMIIWTALQFVINNLNFIMISSVLNNTRWNLPLVNYPECEPCSCGNFYVFKTPKIIGFITDIVSSIFNQDGEMSDEEFETGDDTVDVPDCSGIVSLRNNDPVIDQGWGQDDRSSWMNQFGKDEHGEPLAGRGCYSFMVGNGPSQIVTTIFIFLIVCTALSFIPFTAALGWQAAYYGIMAAKIVMMISLMTNLTRLFFALNEWRVRRNIYDGLCQGIPNGTLSNTWLRGSLYLFNFKNNRYMNQGQPTEEYCDSLIWKDSISYGGSLPVSGGTYYYRSCPTNMTSQNALLNALNGPFNGFQKEVGTITESRILFPTTIIELGPLTFCESNDCLECLTGETECYLLEEIRTSSHQDFSEIIEHTFNWKLNKLDFWELQFTNINRWFGPSPIWGGSGNNRKNRLMDGDITQLIAQNCEFGIAAFENPQENPTNPFYAIGTTSGVPFGFDLKDNAFNHVVERRSDFNLIQDNPSIRDCLLGPPAGHIKSQTIPFYRWHTAVGGYGNWNNNWDVRDIQLDYSQPGKWGVLATNPVYMGYTANTTTQNYRLSHFHQYYFGLRRGASAYDNLRRRYLPVTDE